MPDYVRAIADALLLVYLAAVLSLCGCVMLAAIQDRSRAWRRYRQRVEDRRQIRRLLRELGSTVVTERRG